MNDFAAAVDFRTVSVSPDIFDFRILNNKGYDKMQIAIKEKDREILESAICDFQIALNCFKQAYPEATYYIGQANLNYALNLRAVI